MTTKARQNYGKALAFIEWAISQQTDDCIMWPFGLLDSGYPNIGHGKRVNRVVCEKVHGPPPSWRHHAAHECGNRACINHRHIKWKTPKANAEDKIKHGTARTGEKHPRAKLSNSDVAAIRASTEKAPVLAAHYGVSVRHIYQLRK